MSASVRHTIFSPDRRYRYVLWREWDLFHDRYAMVTLLNPSTADEWANDPTVRRCISFAQAWGFGGLCLTNAFAYRATNPRELRRARDPVGPENDRWLFACAGGASLHLVGWGVHGRLRGRSQAVAEILKGYSLMCLGVTADGSPRHPLYVPKAYTPIPWRMNASNLEAQPG